MVTLRELRRERRPKRVRVPPPLPQPGASHAEEEVDGKHSDVASSCESSRHHHHHTHHSHHSHHHEFHPNHHPYVNVVNTFPARAPCAYRYWSDMPCAVSSYEVVYHPPPPPPPPPPRYLYPPPYGPCYAGPPPYVTSCPGACPVYSCAPRC